MIVLAVETATEACSAAVYRDGTVVERYQVSPRQHHRLILPMIEEVLAEAGIALSEVDSLAFGRGPGSFTGIRIATGVVQGIGYAADLPVVPVSTLAALALEAMDQDPATDWVFPCLDARMNEVYWAVYRRDVNAFPMLHAEEQVISPARIDLSAFPAGCGIGIGSGWVSYGDAIRAPLPDRVANVLADRFPRAGCVARIGARCSMNAAAVPATAARPVYLRDQVVQKLKAE